MYEIEKKLADYIVNEIKEEGLGIKDNYCFIDKPSEKYFVGSLLPKYSIEDNNSEFIKKLKPSSVGLDTLYVSEGDAIFIINIYFSVFYKVYPSYQDFKNNGIHCYKRIDLDLSNIEIKIKNEKKETEISNYSDINLKKRIDNAIEKAHEIIRKDKRAYRKGTVLKRFDEISNETDYYNEIKSIEGDIILPNWNPVIIIQNRKNNDGSRRIKVYLENDSEEEKRQKEYDLGFFNANIELEVVNGKFIPFKFNLLPEDYRYNKELWGLGHNCNPVISDDGKKMKTDLAPTFIQKRYVTTDKVKPDFQKLADDPIPILENIKLEMEKYFAEWEKNVNELEAIIPYEELEERRKDLQNFRIEIDRFDKGLNAISSKDIVKEAFCLMNRTFANKDLKRKKPFKCWRMFQIVFIVMIIGDIISREFKDFTDEGLDYVDVIWFPTGGGKTEAYLGLSIFSAFFDRLRGKKSGVTSWIKFPLRLLSIQQFQRIVDIYSEAEKIRLRHDIIGSDDYDNFSIGYFVGSENTPNQLDEDFIEKFFSDPLKREKYKLIEHCPYCGQEGISVEIDEYEHRLVHKCNNSDCCYEKLPLYIVDNEIYRYLPTMIVSTVDKLALIGVQRRIAHIFGNFDEKCRIHGFMSCGECTADKDCKEDKEKVNIYDPSPLLIIQDELHLLRESFGTFASHYESFIDILQQKINEGARAKIIAATATIEKYEYQIKHLYNRKARRFPVPGYLLRSNFYAQEIDKVGRIFVGIMPHNNQHLDASRKILTTFHKLIQKINEFPQKYIEKIGLNCSEQEFLNCINYYKISLTYVNSRDDAANISRNINDQLESELLNNNLSEINNKVLTGSSYFKDIRKALNILEEPELFPEEDRIDSVVATSLISHGVDIDRLNFMVFHGMPRSTAEYIQSSSRVGRNHVGIDIICFKPGSEKDLSYFNYFKKFNEFSDLLVEPIPINRWSKFSIDKTFSGLLMAIILQYYQPIYRHNVKNNMYLSKGIQEAIDKGFIKKDEVIEILEKAYGVDNEGSEAANDFKKKINRLVSAVFVAFNNPVEEKATEQLRRVISYSPMLSLRDIDKEIIINVNADSEEFVKRLNRRF
jgi:hypothetical protein